MVGLAGLVGIGALVAAGVRGAILIGILATTAVCWVAGLSAPPAEFFAVPRLPTETLWPWLLEHLEILDEAFGLRPQSGEKPFIRLAALELLEHFPKVPQRYLQPLMWLATGT